MSDIDTLTAAPMSQLSTYSPTGDPTMRRLFDSPGGDRLCPAMADLSKQPGSAAPAEVIRAQVHAVEEADPPAPFGPAGMVDAPRPARYGVTINQARNVQIGDGNVQNNVSSDGPAWLRPRNVILTVFSNPFGTDGLRLDEEYRTIAQAIQAGRYREHLDIVSAPAARYHEIGPDIQHHRPVVVHVGVHGSQTGELVFADESGRPFDVSTSALAGLFANHAATIRCVVLNGCFTKRLADAIAMHGPCVVGTSRAIPDALAIEFAGAFYTAVANGRRFDEAFADGRNRLDLGDRAGGDAIVFAEGRGGRCGTAIE